MEKAKLNDLQCGMCPKCGHSCDSIVAADSHGPMAIYLTCQKCDQVWSVFPTRVDIAPLEKDHSVDGEKVVVDVDWSKI